MPHHELREEHLWCKITFLCDVATWILSKMQNAEKESGIYSAGTKVTPVQLLSIILNWNKYPGPPEDPWDPAALANPAWLWVSQPRVVGTLKMDKSRRINFSLGRWVPRDQNALKLGLHTCQGASGAFRISLHLLLGMCEDQFGCILVHGDPSSQ